MDTVKITAFGIGYTRDILLTFGYTESDLIRFGLATTEPDQLLADVERGYSWHLDDKAMTFKSTKK